MISTRAASKSISWFVLLLLTSACSHSMESAKAPFTQSLTSSQLIERVTVPGDEVVALSVFSISTEERKSSEKQWDFYGAPFVTVDGVSVYESYTRVDAAGKPYRSYVKVRDGRCMDAREIAKSIGAGLDSPRGDELGPVYRRDSGSNLLFLYANGQDHCLKEIAARRK